MAGKRNSVQVLHVHVNKFPCIQAEVEELESGRLCPDLHSVESIFPLFINWEERPSWWSFKINKYSLGKVNIVKQPIRELVAGRTQKMEISAVCEHFNSACVEWEGGGCLAEGITCKQDMTVRYLYSYLETRLLQMFLWHHVGSGTLGLFLEGRSLNPGYEFWQFCR